MAPGDRAISEPAASAPWVAVRPRRLARALLFSAHMGALAVLPWVALVVVLRPARAR